MKIKILLISLIFLFVCCNQEAPEIIQHFWQFDNIAVSESKFMTKLNLYIQMKSDTAFQDMDKIYLINDKHELYWEIDSTEASYVNKNKENWIGSPHILMNEIDPDEEFPEGLYRILFYDIRAYKSQREIYLKKSNFKKTLPKISVKKDSYEIVYNKLPYYLRLYDEKNQIIQIRKVTSEIYNLMKRDNTLNKKPDYFTVYYFDPKNGEGIISKKFTYFSKSKK